MDLKPTGDGRGCALPSLNDQANGPSLWKAHFYLVEAMCSRISGRDRGRHGHRGLHDRRRVRGLHRVHNLRHVHDRRRGYHSRRALRCREMSGRGYSRGSFRALRDAEIRHDIHGAGHSDCRHGRAIRADRGTKDPLR